MSEPQLLPVLGRLLGPGQPEVPCETCFAELDRYVEAELAGIDPETVAPGMRAHLHGCPACAEEHHSLLDLLRHEQDQTGGPPTSPPPAPGSAESTL